jgi:hypothetical protein
LLPVLAHPAGCLIDVTLEPGDLIGERLFAFAELLLLLVARGLPVARKLVDASRYFFLPLQRFLRLLSKLLHALLTTGALSRFKHPPRLLHSVERAKLLSGRFSVALR